MTLVKQVDGEDVELTPEEIATWEAEQAAIKPGLYQYRVAIQEVVDSKAQERRYDNGNSLASYVNSTIAEWATEAAAFVAWRDQVWAYAYAALAEVEAGVRPAPTVAEILSELPVMAWPE